VDNVSGLSTSGAGQGGRGRVGGRGAFERIQLLWESITAQQCGSQIDLATGKVNFSPIE